MEYQYNLSTRETGNKESSLKVESWLSLVSSSAFEKALENLMSVESLD